MCVGQHWGWVCWIVQLGLVRLVCVWASIGIGIVGFVVNYSSMMELFIILHVDQLYSFIEFYLSLSPCILMFFPIKFSFSFSFSLAFFYGCSFDWSFNPVRFRDKGLKKLVILDLFFKTL